MFSFKQIPQATNAFAPSVPYDLAGGSSVFDKVLEALGLKEPGVPAGSWRLPDGTIRSTSSPAIATPDANADS